MDYPTGLISLIDQRIDESALKPTKMGTVQDRETATARAIVSFDGGSGIGQPVKCFETVVVDIGDRVGMIKFEGEWIIIGNYTDRRFGEQLNGSQSVTATTTSASFAAIPDAPITNVAKYRDSTQFQIFIATCMYTTVAPTVVEIAANILFPDTTTVDQVLYRRAINAASDHRDMSGGLTTPGLTMPGGGYSITARWRRVSGTGTLTQDSNDYTSIWVREVSG